MAKATALPTSPVASVSLRQVASQPKSAGVSIGASIGLASSGPLSSLPHASGDHNHDARDTSRSTPPAAAPLAPPLVIAIGPLSSRANHPCRVIRPAALVSFLLAVVPVRMASGIVPHVDDRCNEGCDDRRRVRQHGILWGGDVPCSTEPALRAANPPAERFEAWLVRRIQCKCGTISGEDKCGSPTIC
jgi:hypothetical protein